MTYRILLFGVSGAIGRAVCDGARGRDWTVTAVSRGAPSVSDDPLVTRRQWDPCGSEDARAVAADAPFDAVCWAQGANLADSPRAFDAAQHRALYDANVLTVLQSMSALVTGGLLAASGARLVVVSSIWQERARADKLSYTVTKAAIGGLVRAASVDLGREGHLVNGVLPGVLDTPMAHANLSPAQIDTVAGKTTLGRLPDLATLAQTIVFLCSPDNKAISGQSISVDLGMSNACLV